MRLHKSGIGGIGGKVRGLRREQRLSVRTLAARPGFSPFSSSFISQLEAEAVSPSIASLQKAAQQLGVSLGQFFSSLERAPREVELQEGDVAYISEGSRFSWENRDGEEAALVMVAAPGRGGLVSSLLGEGPEETGRESRKVAKRSGAS